MQKRGRQGNFRSLRLPLRAPKRNGVVVLEFIIAIPLLIILVLAVVEFALIFRVNQQVAAASKYGAKLASEISRAHTPSPNLGDFNTTANPSLKDRIDLFLTRQGLTESCGVFLEHNACSAPNSQQLNPVSPPANCNCTPPNPPAFPAIPGPVAPPTEASYVRVTVGLPLAVNVPDLLNYFGFSVGDRIFRHTTTMRIEPNNTPPSVSVSGTLDGLLPEHHVVTSMDGFPLSCGNSITIANPSGSTTLANAIVTIDFNGSNSSDNEEQISSLGFSWVAEVVSGTGATVNAMNLVNGSAQDLNNLAFAVPSDPNVSNVITEPDNIFEYRITLTVTDSCGQSDNCMINVQIITRDSVPAP